MFWRSPYLIMKVLFFARTNDVAAAFICKTENEAFQMSSPYILDIYLWLVLNRFQDFGRFVLASVVNLGEMEELNECSTEPKEKRRAE